MMLLLDWRYLISEQYHIIHHSPLIHIIVNSGMMHSISTTKILHETCTKVWPAYLATVTKLDHARERIAHIMEKEIPAMVPNFKLKPLEPEPTSTTAYPTTI